MARYTLSQLLSAIEETDPDDPHAGHLPIDAIDEAESAWRMTCG